MIEPTLDFAPARGYMLAALEHASGTHSIEDVEAGVFANTFQLFRGAQSAILTQVQQYPRKTVLCVFLAGGLLNELLTMLPDVLEWGRQHGCTGAYIAGRPGWARALDKLGWAPTQVILEKDL
jgi:hypothetical protein